MRIIISPSLVNSEKPDWKSYIKVSRLTLNEATALTLNKTEESSKKLRETDENFSKTFEVRLKRLANEAASSSGTPGAISVLDVGNKQDKSDWTVDILSFIKFSRNTFKDLPDGFLQLSTKKGGRETRQAKITKTEKDKTPIKFIEALNRTLNEISKRCQKQNKKFNKNEMPGMKANLMALMVILEEETCDTSLNTFSGYIKGKCQFLQGARDSYFYKELFPEHKIDLDAIQVHKTKRPTRTPKEK